MLYIGSDHAGFRLKEYIKKYFAENNILFKDLGVHTQESSDYPVISKKLCCEVLKDQNNKGILICGTGIGVCIAANKIKGIRAALCSDSFLAEMCRKHNNANVLCIGAKVLDNDKSVDIVNNFLSADFEGGRHSRRVDQITEIEKYIEKTI
ncbi:MAG: ribose 5-phosphate isomerase B [Oscillospiraceae bacterium]|jgi:ribose 5-phosphate isomerase B|nr:ribose 5-phosphate isomerase B [Oscillospiraceae bacterium]